MSAPAAKTFSPPYTITARTSSSLAAWEATSKSEAVRTSFSALTGGRSRRIVPMPSATSSRTNSPMSSILSAQVAVCHAGRRLRVGDQPELGAARQQRMPRQHPPRVAERPGAAQRDLAGVTDVSAVIGDGRKRRIRGRGDLIVLPRPSVNRLDADIVPGQVAQRHAGPSGEL